MKTLRIFSLCLLLCSLAVLPAIAATVDELERRLDRQERRIDSLERALESLQYQQSAPAPAPSASGSRPAAQHAADPLIGVWDCTNNIFNYEITFHPNGRLVQEEPAFSKIRSSRWGRTTGNEFVTEGHAWKAEFRDNDEVTITNLTDHAEWSCYRKQ